MKDTPRNLQQLVIGTAAVIFTVAAAGAAVVVNLGTADPASGSPAGQLASTQSVVTSVPDTLTPSTIYVDVDVPVPGGVPADVTSGAGTPSSTGTGAAPASASRTDDDRDDSHDDRTAEAREHEDGTDDDD